MFLAFILQSGGDLENDEHAAEVIYNLVSLADKVDGVEGFNKISGMQ